MKEQSDFNSRNQSTSLLTEKRRYVRVQLNLKAHIAGFNQIFQEATIIDISTGGARIQTDCVNPSENISILVSFRLGTGYLLSADVVWQLHTKPESYIMGVQWTSLVDSEREFLTREIMRIAVNRRRLRR